MNDGSWQVFDKTGRVTESHGPTDNRSGPEKFVDGFANAADRTASLVGLGSHGVGESWQAVGTGAYRIVSFPFREMHESMMAAATYNPAPAPAINTTLAPTSSKPSRSWIRTSGRRIRGAWREVWPSTPPSAWQLRESR